MNTFAQNSTSSEASDNSQSSNENDGDNESSPDTSENDESSSSGGASSGETSSASGSEETASAENIQNSSNSTTSGTSQESTSSNSTQSEDTASDEADENLSNSTSSESFSEGSDESQNAGSNVTASEDPDAAGSAEQQSSLNSNSTDQEHDVIPPDSPIESLVTISGEPLLPSDTSIKRTFSYPLLEFIDDDTVNLTVTIVWNTDGTVEISDDRGYKYTLTIPTSSGSFTLLSNSTTIDQKFISDELQFDLYWTAVENSDGDITKYKFLIAGTSMKENSEIIIGLDGGQHVRIVEDRFTVEQPNRKVDALSDGEQKRDPSLDWTPKSVKEQNNNIPPQESLFSRNADKAVSGDFGLDWSDAVASGYWVEFNETSSSIQIPVGKSFVIDPTTVATVPLQVSPSTSESSEGERRVVRVDSKLYAFYYDGSNILYKSSTDDGYTWSSATSLETGVVASDYHRWAVTTTSISGSNYISVLYWVPNGSNMDFYALRGTVTASSVTWSDHILLGYTWANSGACGSGGACAAAVATTDTQGNIYAAFTWLSGGATQYSYQIMKSTDGGLNWGTSLSQIYPVSTSKPTMALTKLDSGKMLFAYTNYDSSDFKYRVYDGSTWGSEQNTSAGSGMSTSTLKQISAASNSTNFGFIAYVTGGTSGTLKVARFSNTGTFQTYETANSTLSHSLPSIVITPSTADSVIRIYTISGGKVYETKKDATWQNSFNPFGTSFTSLNQLSAAANDPSALWIENSANPYNLRFERDTPTITWTASSGNARAVPNIIQQLNYTSDISIAYADIVVSSAISNYVTSMEEGTYNIPERETQYLGMTFGIPPNSVSGWHNGTISLLNGAGQLVNSYSMNVNVPTMEKATVQVQDGTVDYILTPSDSPFFEDTADLAIYKTFTNGTRMLVHVQYDLFPTSSGSGGGFSAMSILAPFTSAYDWLTGLFNPTSSEKNSFTLQEAYAQGAPECTSYGFRYDYRLYGGADGANVASDLAVAADTVNSNSSSPLLVRLDIYWNAVDNGTFDSNGDWVPNYNNSGYINDVFDKVVNGADKKAIIILGTHQPPDAIKTDIRGGIQNIENTGVALVIGQVFGPDAPNSVAFLPVHRSAANSFIQYVVDYINSNSTMSNSVAYWQIDNEPNLRVPTEGLRPDWATLADALNEWTNIVKQADLSKKTIINAYQDNRHPFIPEAFVILGDRTLRPFSNILTADDQIGQQLASNLDVMGFDVYPDQFTPFASDSDQIAAFNDALLLIEEQLDIARTEVSYAGKWGILELAAGPKIDNQFFSVTPTANTVGQMAALAKNAEFETPELIIFFQLRANNLPEGAFWDQSYGLINHTSGSVHASFQDAIEGNVTQNCPVFPVTHMLDITASTGLTTYSGRQSHVELVTSSSQLVGDKIDQITVRLSKTGSPTGTVQIGVFNSDRSVKQLFGSVSAATLTSSYIDYNFTLTGGQLYTIASGDRIGIKFTGGSSSNAVRIMTDNNSADPFDGSDSYRQHYTTSWQTFTSQDLYMTLRQTHG